MRSVFLQVLRTMSVTKGTANPAGPANDSCESPAGSGVQQCIAAVWLNAAARLHVRTFDHRTRCACLCTWLALADFWLLACAGFSLSTTQKAGWTSTSWSTTGGTFSTQGCRCSQTTSSYWTRARWSSAPTTEGGSAILKNMQRMSSTASRHVLTCTKRYNLVFGVRM